MTSRWPRALTVFLLVAAAFAVVIGSNMRATPAAPLTMPVDVNVVNAPNNPANVTGVVKVFDHGAVFNRDLNYIDEQEWPASGKIELDMPNLLSMPFEIENVNAVVRLQTPSLGDEVLRYLYIEVQNPDGTKSRRYIPMQKQSESNSYTWFVANESVKLFGNSSASVKIVLQKSQFSLTQSTAIYVSIGGHFLQLPG